MNIPNFLTILRLFFPIFIGIVCYLKLDINPISAETLNTTTDEIKNLNVQLNVLKKKNNNSKSKKICIHTLNKRLYLARKKDKFRNLAILSAIFVSVGLVGFIAG